MSTHVRPTARLRRLAAVTLPALLLALASAGTGDEPAAALGATTECEQVIAVGVRATDQTAGTSPRYWLTDNTGLGKTVGALATEMRQSSSLRVRKVGLVYPAAGGIHYSASKTEGVANLSRALNSLATRCPGSRTVLIGWSQGAHVIGETLERAYENRIAEPGFVAGLTFEARSRVAGAVFFGDPGYRAGEWYNAESRTKSGIFMRNVGALNSWYGRVISYCKLDDWACQGTWDLGHPAHESYAGTDITKAAAWVEARLLGSSSTSGSNWTPIPTGDGVSTQSEGVIAQEIAQAGGYTGPVDGIPGPMTWSGVQQVVKGYGYTGPIDGAPGTYTYMAFQRLAQKGGYTGPIDGAPGTYTWRGIQTVLRGFGYTGPIDGVPGTYTYMALQRLAKLGGYTGPVDGALGPNSWKGVQQVLAGYGYTGPVDGVPGTNTFMALQRMAQKGGYTGPVDGVPGPYTWAALGRLI